MNKILIGTTSWTDKTLITSGLFYPRGTKSAEARLRYYASQFPIVEVDSSYYAMPAERNSVLWVERTPAAFTFDIKAFRLFTQHQTPLTALPADIRNALGKIDKANVYYRDFADELIDEMWARFRTALAPLGKAGKLGVVVFQFPPWFVYRRSNLDHILQCAQRLDGYQIAVEFRNISWLGDKHRDDVLAFEKEHHLTHVAVDEPQGFSSSTPAVWEVTCPEVAAVRLHGRNRANWERKGLTAAERFNYLYSEDELKEFVDPVRKLAARARRVHVLFNNCYRNNAQQNAAELQSLID